MEENFVFKVAELDTYQVVAETLHTLGGFKEMILDVHVEVVRSIDTSKYFKEEDFVGFAARNPWIHKLSDDGEDGLIYKATLCLDRLEFFYGAYSNLIHKAGATTSALSVFIYSALQMYADIYHRNELINAQELEFYEEQLDRAKEHLENNDNLDMINMFDPLFSLNHLMVITLLGPCINGLLQITNQPNSYS